MGVVGVARDCIARSVFAVRRINASSSAGAKRSDDELRFGIRHSGFFRAWVLRHSSLAHV